MINFRSALIAGILAAGAFGCVTDGGQKMDMQAAAERSDAILDAVLREIRPELRWTHGPTTVGSCDVSRRRVVMTEISAERRGNLLGVVDRFWRESGYRMTVVNNDAEFPAI
ncbi:hypothetical protein ACFWRG_33690, partial [Micromonospora tulbaghiae]|uniref:hypothetical protein n=1 Tax=Micromonospora tulbaghiae TaxID=479978 RepID=UPI003663D01B